LLGLEIDPDGMRILSVDVHLLHHVELDVVVGGKLLDLSCGPWLLGAELIAGEGKDGESSSFSSILLMELNQLVVIHLGLASLAGDVDDDQDLALVLLQVDQLSVQALGAELVD